MLVYRMETEDGTGIYSIGTRCPAQEIEGAHPVAHGDTEFVINFSLWKTYNSESGIYPYHDFVFCFNSVSQWKRWFYNVEWILWAIQHKVKLSVYEVDADFVIQGTTQCTFYKEQATMANDFVATEMLNIWESI